MQLSDLTIRLLLLFFPGIICHFIVDGLTAHRDRRPYQVLLHAYVYGVTAYVLYAVIAALRGTTLTTEQGLNIPPSGTLLFSKSLTDSNIPLDFVEIGLVTIVAVLLGFFVSFASNHNWLHRSASRLGVSKKFGDPNTWSFAFNSPNVRWAVLRDIDRNLMFQGYILGFSDVEDVAEVVLMDVIVYNEKTGKKLYRADRMYLSRRRDDMTIEFPNPPSDG